MLLEHELGVCLAGIQSDFQQTQATWNSRDKARFKTRELPGSVEVYTNDKPYTWVDSGTPRHTITPRSGKKSGGRLVFKERYSPKTTQFVIGSQTSASSGRTVLARRVQHRGIKPRYFAREISKKWQSIFRRKVNYIMAREARR